MDDLAQPQFPYPLVTTEWLGAELGAPDLKIVDASWRMPGNPPAHEDHVKRRLPGAVFFDLDAVADHSTDLPHMLPEQGEFAAAAGALGLRAEDRIIVYDDAGVFSAARIWWTFRAMGHNAVSVLDGGLPKWLAEGRPTVAGAAASVASVYTSCTERRLARTARDVRNALAGGARVLDARPTARFAGEAPEPRPRLRSGHMPGASSLPHTLLLGPDGAFRPIDELARLFRERGVHMDTPVIATCGSGVTAAILILALERLGHRNHGLYDGSWAEWGAEQNDPGLFPVAAGRGEHDPSV